MLERAERGGRHRLMRDANAYARATGVCDPKYISGTITMEALVAFGIPVTGKNLIDAELMLSLHKLGVEVGDSHTTRNHVTNAIAL